MKRLLIAMIITGIFFFIQACDTNLEISLEENPYISFIEVEIEKDKTLEFALVLPEIFNEDETYPVLLAFPPGDQTRYQVEGALDQYWIRSSIQRNWIVVSPVAPTLRFYEGSEELIPGLMDWITEHYHVEGDKFHIAGHSAGGFSSFRVATMYPEKFHSLTAMPGYPVSEDDFNNLHKLANMHIAMVVGLFDDSFLEAMEITKDHLEELGMDVFYKIVPMDGHLIVSLSGNYWFNLLDSFRPEH